MGKPLMIQMEDDDRIEKLKEKMGAKTKIDVVRTALKLLEADVNRRWTASPAAKLDVAGEVKIGNTTGTGTTCVAAQEGLLRYNSTSKKMQFCDGTNWVTAFGGTPPAPPPGQMVKWNIRCNFTITNGVVMRKVLYAKFVSHDREIASVRSENAAMKTYLCERDPAAAFCK